MFLIRKILSPILSVSMIILLLTLTFAWFLKQDFSTPNKIDTWLQKSNLYGSVINDLSDQAVNSLPIGGVNNKTIHKQVTLALEQSINPSFFYDTVNKVVAANFSWLQGKTSQPLFSIDLSSVQTAFIQNLALDQQSSSNLCPQASYGGRAYPNVCMLAGQYLSSKYNLLNQTSLNQNNISSFLSTKNVSNSNYYIKHSSWPSDYQRAMKLYIDIAILILILAIISIILFGLKLRFIKFFIKSVLISSVILIVFKFISNPILRSILNLSFVTNNPNSLFVIRLLQLAANDIDRYIIVFIKAYLIAVVALIIVWLLSHLVGKSNNKKQKHKNQDKHNPGSELGWLNDK